MGQFSWLTKSGEQIRNEHHQGQKVWMVFKANGGVLFNGEVLDIIVVREDKYEGYGMFGGLDYYEVLYDMNSDKISGYPDGTDPRDIGIDLVYGQHELNGKVEFPQLFTHEPSINEIESINWFEPNPEDPNQGWVVDDEWYDEDE